MNYSIVEASDNNLNECASILCQEYNNNMLNEGWAKEDALKYCKFYFKLQPDIFFVAKNDSEVVGFTFAYIKPWAKGNILMLEELCVKKEFRRKGIAKRLLQRIISTALINHNIVNIKGETYGTTYEMPFSWYQRLGFYTNKDTYLISGSPEIVLQKLS